MKKPPPLAAVADLASLPLLLTIDEVAVIYRVSAATIRRQVQEGTFRPRPFDKYPYRWLRADVERDLREPRRNQKARPHGFASPTGRRRGRSITGGEESNAGSR